MSLQAEWTTQGLSWLSGRLCPVTLPPPPVSLQATLNCPPVVWGLGLQPLLMPTSRWASVLFVCFNCRHHKIV